MRGKKRRTLTPFLAFCTSLLPVSLLALGSCDVDLGPRVPPTASSFGNIVFREACQRVTFSNEIAQGEAGSDVSGNQARVICQGAAAPVGAAPSLQALFAQRQNIIGGVDTGVPVDLQDPLDTYLRAVQPLQDDGTMTTLLQQAGDALQKLAADDGAMRSLSKLSHLTGLRPAATAGGLIRATASAPGFDDFVGSALPLLDKSGVAEADLQALLTGLAFELRHLERTTEDPNSPERTPALLRKLLTTARPELLAGKSLQVALRDSRGLPLLEEVVAPYVKDPATGLAKADEDGYFLDGAGRRIAYVPPLPEPGNVGAGSRDAAGRALRPDGKLLYKYAELDGTLLPALLVDAQRLADDAPAVAGGARRDMLFGLLRGAALLGGARKQLTKTRDGETLTYSGFDKDDSALLDLAHGGLQLLRFGSGGAMPAQELTSALTSAKTLLGTEAYQGPLARALKALLDAADEAKKPAYAAAQLPDKSTLFDDLVPIISRLLAIDNGGLVEDVLTALQDPHSKNLGPIMAQLADERSLFFMRQSGAMDGLDNLAKPCSPSADENLNGLSPCGVVGNFGNKVDRAAADSDATIDWRGKKTDDPKNNRSVLQRLLHMIADSNNGRPFCNGRYATVFGGLVQFNAECDMFQVDSVARFFLLSMATPALRDRTDTLAKSDASFREAMRNSRNCRGVSGDPAAASKCQALLNTIDDGINGDQVLSGMMGIVGFGRYPNSEPAARAIFADVAAATTGASKRTQDLVFNHTKVVDGMGNATFPVDSVDADNRKFRDGTGQDRLFIDEHNGVLFALEKVRAPAKLPDGSTNQFPNDNFYDAMRPLVDAFAKHAECLQRDMTGTCTKAQNATQILADALGVLHKHFPTAKSSRFGRSFANTYGPLVAADGAVTYEPLLAKILGGDLLLATADLSPILLSMTTDGQMGSPRALPVLLRLGRYVFDPAVGPPGGIRYRDQRAVAMRNDGQPAGPVTPFYLLADALQKKKTLLNRPENAVAKQRWDRAISDVIDLLLKVNVSTDGMGNKKYVLDNPRLRPMAQILLDFAVERVAAHGPDLAGWSSKLSTDLTDLLTGPLATAGIDVGSKLSDNDQARAKTYALLRGLLDDKNEGARTVMQVVALDGLQLLLADADLTTLGHGLASVVDPKTGPALAGITLLRRGHELEQSSSLVAMPKQVLVRLLRSLYKLDGSGLHPMWRLSDAIGEVNRKNLGAAGDYTAADYRTLLDSTGKFLVEQQRGLLRFIQIVQSRCLPGSGQPGCPAL